MTPFKAMQAMYLRHPQARPFEWYLQWHLEHAYIWSTPQYFMMGRAVKRDWFEPSVLQSHPEPDSWYIHAMSGDMPSLWSIMPYPLPFIGWERIRGGVRELQWFSSSTLRRHCPAHETPTPAA